MRRSFYYPGKGKTCGNAVVAKIVAFIMVAMTFTAIITAKADEAEALFGRINITVWLDELPVSMELEDYVLGVVAAEMPASFEVEALKAQAIAARTYALKKAKAMGGTGCQTHGAADVCTHGSCCQEYVSVERMKENWGEDLEENYSKLAEAVAQTDGEVLTYDDELILALYHADSGGCTEDVENVFMEELPYLRAVESPWESGDNARIEEFSFSYGEIDDLLNGIYGAFAASEGDIEILNRLPSGRVGKIRVGDAELTGAEFRLLLGLDSANFYLECADAVHITTYGYGHGVGLSQQGANKMALEGKNYREILKWYYTGVDISRVL